MNNSATLPAAVDGTRTSSPITVHFSGPRGDVWVVELRPAANATGTSRMSGPVSASACPTAPPSSSWRRIPEPAVTGSRLWVSARSRNVTSYLARTGGDPLRYVPRPGR